MGAEVYYGCRCDLGRASEDRVTHTHVGVLLGLPAVLSVLIFFTCWKLVAYHMLTSKSTTLNNTAKAMLFQAA